MMKSIYEVPEMEITNFEMEDIITSSTMIDGGSGDGPHIDLGNLGKN